ncbi:MAG: Ig-like domain-containing protein, partial [Longimicrobiales bacterium]|nr:Ig-like domain-containing protein [Longimicrobiales bacterium]
MTFPIRRFACGAAVAVLLPLAATSCGETSVTAVDVGSVTVSPSQATVVVGETVQLQATVRDESGNVLGDRPVTWSSDDPGVATVQDGLVRGIGPGTVLIRASSGDFSAQSEVTVLTASSIVLSQGVLAFEGRAGEGPTAAQVVGITNGGEAPLAGLQTTVSYGSTASGWLDVTLAGTTAPTNLSVRADPSALSAGTYRADVEVIASGADNSPQVIEVTFEVAEALPAIQVDPTTVGFAVAEGEGVPQPENVSVTNIGGGDLTGLEASIAYDEGEPTGWLDAVLAGTTAPTDLTLSVDPSGLESPISVCADVNVTSPVAVSSERVRVCFALGEPPPEIDLDPTAIAWDIVEDDVAPPTRKVDITNRGTGVLGDLFSVVEYGPDASGWLGTVIDPDVAPTVLTATLATTALLPGEYVATILVYSDSAASTNSPQPVDVSLSVAPRASPVTSTISTSHSERVADGSSTATITVELRDKRGALMPSGGDNVQLVTDLGELSSVTDVGDGTYTATLTSTTSGLATVTGVLNGDPMDDEATVEFVAGPPATVRIVAGNNQSAVVGTTLASPLQVEVTDAFGNLVGGTTVNWTPASGDGTASPTSSTTNASGVTSTDWTLGTTAGPQSLVASASGAQSATFDATGQPGPADALVIIDGDGQTGVVGEALTDPLVVEVQDQYGNAVPAGVSVSWQPNSGGTADPESSTTDASGRATTSWILGPSPGDQTMDASVTDLTPVTFSATAEEGAPANIQKVAGDGQTGTVDQTLANSLQVEVTDAFGNPVSGVTVTWAPSGGGSASPTSSTTNASGIASTDWTLGTTAGGQTMDASTSVAGSVSFTATAEAGAPANIQKVAGDNQTGTVGQTLTSP